MHMLVLARLSYASYDCHDVASVASLHWFDDKTKQHATKEPWKVDSVTWGSWLSMYINNWSLLYITPWLAHNMSCTLEQWVTMNSLGWRIDCLWRMFARHYNTPSPLPWYTREGLEALTCFIPKKGPRLRDYVCKYDASISRKHEDVIYENVWFTGDTILLHVSKKTTPQYLYICFCVVTCSCLAQHVIKHEVCIAYLVCRCTWDLHVQAWVPCILMVMLLLFSWNVIHNCKMSSRCLNNCAKMG